MKWDLKNKQKTKQFANVVKKRVTNYSVMAGIQAYSDVSVKTPVDTGRARYSWYCSINTIDYTTTPEGKWVFDPLRASKAFASAKPSDNLYIANSTPYIKSLNQGSSTQAPARFVEMTVEKVQRSARKLANEAQK